MRVITTRNVQQALPEGLRQLQLYGYDRDSRNGRVRLFNGPVTTRYSQPRERVLFWEVRDANPFFHLFESLWMLAGRNDVKFPASFVKRMKSFSDDGKTFHGAYGHRWRQHFGYDQLSTIATVLRENPDDRRCVLQMWDARVDLGRTGKDFPCNTQIYFAVSINPTTQKKELDMTVCCRSNDMVWGAYGANAVHMSVLQEYMAAAVGVEVGTYWQLSNNFHAYYTTMQPLLDEGLIDSADDGMRSVQSSDPYALGLVEPFPLVQTDIVEWGQDLMMFLEEGPVIGLRDPFFRRVATPMWNAYHHLKNLDNELRFDEAKEIMAQCSATDWRLACNQWIDRRQLAVEKKGRQDAAE
jgi:hypothetical protein